MTIIDWLSEEEARFPIAKAPGEMLDKRNLEIIPPVGRKSDLLKTL
jgi:hypothetical protein